PPGVAHADVYVPALSNHEVLWCSYQDEKVSAGLHRYEPVDHFLSIDQMSATAPPQMASLLYTLQAELKHQEESRHVICESLVTVLTHQMLRAFQHQFSSLCEPLNQTSVVRRVHDYLYQHYQKPVALDDIAQSLHF